MSDQPENVPQDTPKEETPKEASYFNKTGSNAQQDGVNSLKRIEFEFRKQRYRFILNPEQLTQEEPNRVSVMQTKSSAWVDDFGGGLVNIAFKGTTGFKNQSGIGTDGFDQFKTLRDMIRQYYFKQTPGTEVKEEDELLFFNHTDGEAWVVVPKVFSLMRSVSRPLLYLYDIQLVAIRPATLPTYIREEFRPCMSDIHVISNQARRSVQQDLARGIVSSPHSSPPIETTVVSVSPSVLTHQLRSVNNTSSSSGSSELYSSIACSTGIYSSG